MRASSASSRPLWKRSLVSLLVCLPAVAAPPDCFRLYYGPGKDLAKARACFESAVSRQRCEHQPELDRVYLATMYLDAQGGAHETAKARALLDGCANNWDVELLIEAAHTRDQGEKAHETPLDYCREVAGSTYMLRMCGSMRAGVLDAALEDAAQRVPANARGLYEKATAAWRAFVDADAELAAEQARGGTAESIFHMSSRNENAERRIALFTGAPAPAAQSLDDAERKLAARIPADARAWFTKSQEAWTRYRDAEAALFEKMGADVKARLSAERAKTLSRCFTR